MLLNTGSRVPSPLPSSELLPVGVQYRLTSNYKDPKFISTRVSDKVRGPAATCRRPCMRWGRL